MTVSPRSFRVSKWMALPSRAACTESVEGMKTIPANLQATRRTSCGHRLRSAEIDYASVAVPCRMMSGKPAARA